MTPLTMLLGLALAQAPAGADLEREARALEQTLIAPCCFTQQVSVHQSEAAAEVRRDIRARLAAGDTRQQILDAYVARYGKQILAEPPAEGFELTLHAMPLVTLVLTLALMAFLIRRFTRRPSVPVPAATPTGAGGRYETQLDDELRDLD